MMPDNAISDPDHDDLDITYGDPSLSEYRGWMREGWVGLARTSPCEDDDGKVKIDINFEPAFVTVHRDPPRRPATVHAGAASD